MKQYVLNEDKLPPKLFVLFSPQINKQMDDIYACNQKNVKALYEWYDYIDGIRNHLSNSTIAWDNQGKYWRSRSGEMHLNDFGYDATYMIRISKKTGLPYVYVTNINLNPQNFGLRVSSMSEKRYIYNIDSIITEAINRYLRNNILLAS